MSPITRHVSYTTHDALQRRAARARTSLPTISVSALGLYLSVHSWVSQPSGAGGATKRTFLTGDRGGDAAADTRARDGAATDTVVGFGAAGAGAVAVVVLAAGAVPVAVTVVVTVVVAGLGTGGGAMGAGAGGVAVGAGAVVVVIIAAIGAVTRTHTTGKAQRAHKRTNVNEF